MEPPPGNPGSPQPLPRHVGHRRRPAEVDLALGQIGDEFPDRAAEWDAYLFELRTRASADGTLPQEVTGLVEDVFEPLL